MTVTAYIGLGANLDEPVRQLRAALAELAQLPESRLLRASSLYRNPPMGPQDQPDYVNAVAALETALEPEALLDRLQALEQAHGRRRERRWGARTLDLDLLLYGQVQLATPRLTVPHVGVQERVFVLLPLSEIAPELVFPDGTPLARCLATVSLAGLVRIDD